MANQAHITSLAALETFRSDLIIFLGQMRPVIDEAGAAVVRMKSWLQNEQRDFWENEARRRARRLEEAQAELFNARLSTLQDSTILQHMAVQRAQRAVAEAGQKLANLKKWDQEIENLASPLVKQAGQLQEFLAADMAKAAAYLTQTILLIEAYAKVPAASLPTATAPTAAEPKPSS